MVESPSLRKFMRKEVKESESSAKIDTFLKMMK